MLETLTLGVGARVAKWQTQRTQNPPVATPWEFDPPPGHQTELARPLKPPTFQPFFPLDRLMGLRYSSAALPTE